MRGMFEKATTTNGEITLGYRLGRLFWFSLPATHWRTQGVMVTYRDRRWIAHWLVGRIGLLSLSDGTPARFRRKVTADQQRRDIRTWQRGHGKVG